MNFTKMRFMLLLLVLGMTSVVYGTSPAPNVRVSEDKIDRFDKFEKQRVEKNQVEEPIANKFADAELREGLADLGPAGKAAFYDYVAKLGCNPRALNREINLLSPDEKTELAACLQRFQAKHGKHRHGGTGSFNDLFGYGSHPTPDAVISGALLKWQLDEDNAGSLADCLQKNNYVGVLKACGTYAALNAFLTAPIKVMQNAITKVLDTLISFIGLGVNKGTSVLFHRNAMPVTDAALNRWHKCIFSIISGVKDEASQERVSGDVGKGLLRLNQYQDPEEPVEGD
jgi:hypothetical protein